MRRLTLAGVSVAVTLATLGCFTAPSPPIGRGEAVANGAALSYWCEGFGSPTVLIGYG